MTFRSGLKVKSSYASIQATANNQEGDMGRGQRLALY